MAASLNKVMLMGNLTRNPELRYIAGGSAVCEFGIAINRRFTVNGQERDETTFVDIVVWGRVGESCSRYLAKGSAVFIDGRLQLDQWEDQQGGKRSRLRVVAENVQFIGPRRDGGDNGYAGNNPGGNYNNAAPNGGYPEQNTPGGNGGRSYSGSQPAGPGGYQRGNAAPGANGPGGYAGRGGTPPPPPVPNEAFDVNDDVEDDIPF